MAQVPATPKSKRATRLVKAALLGPKSVLTEPDLATSEQAALALRADRATPPAPAECVTFLIPLVGKHHVGDWPAVEARLAATLQSFLDQEDDRWEAYICCQDSPALPDDPRIHLVPFDDPTPGNDKWRKLACLYDHLASQSPKPGYVMSFDADDLLRKGTVSDMLRGQAPGGYLVELGYVMNHGTCAIGLAGAPTLSQPLRKPFWKLCGSCCAVRFDPAQPGALPFLREMTQHEHRMFPYLAKLAGRRLTPLPRPSVLYVLNHGENFGARRGRVSFKARFVERFRITDPAALAEISDAFPKI